MFPKIPNESLIEVRENAKTLHIFKARRPEALNHCGNSSGIHPYSIDADDETQLYHVLNIEFSFPDVCLQFKLSDALKYHVHLQLVYWTSSPNIFRERFTHRSFQLSLSASSS
jgi:hypothetical protein